MLKELLTSRLDRQHRCFNFLFERFKMYYMPNIVNDFNWTTSLYRPALELPEVRRFKPGKVFTGSIKGPAYTCF